MESVSVLPTEDIVFLLTKEKRLVNHHIRPEGYGFSVTYWIYFISTTLVKYNTGKRLTLVSHRLLRFLLQYLLASPATPSSPLLWREQNHCGFTTKGKISVPRLYALPNSAWVPSAGDEKKKQYIQKTSPPCCAVALPKSRSGLRSDYCKWVTADKWFICSTPAWQRFCLHPSSQLPLC